MAQRTVGTPSVSGPSGPSKAAPSVEYSESKLGEGPTKTVKDGNTTVQSSFSSNQRESFHNTTGQWPPCINPSCKSYGRPHPNCMCYPGHAEENSEYAKGGEVCSSGHGHIEQCEHFASGGEIEENLKFHNDPSSALDHVAAKHGLLHIMTKTGHSKSEDPHKHLEDYVHHSKSGRKHVSHHMQNLLGPQKGSRVDSDKDSVGALKNHLQSLRENPEQMLNVGGNLGSVLPTHGAQLAAKAGTAVNYLNSLKPAASKPGPLDSLMPPDRIAEGHYDRHLSIAQNPMLILQHLKDGTLRPDDMMTLHTLYPGLSKSMGEKAFEEILKAKEKGVEIPYKQKQGLSTLLGQDLDSSMTPASRQAIINSQGPQQAQNQKKTQPKKASGVELKQLNRVNDMYETSLQARQMDKKD